MQPSLFDNTTSEPKRRISPVQPLWTTFPPSVLVYLRTATYMRLRIMLSKLDMPALEELVRAANDEHLTRYRPAKRQRARKARSIP